MTTNTAPTTKSTATAASVTPGSVRVPRGPAGIVPVPGTPVVNPREPMLDRLSVLANVHDEAGNLVSLTEVFSTCFRTDTATVHSTSEDKYFGKPKPIVHPFHDAKITPGTQNGMLRLDGSPAMWLCGYNAFSKYGVCEAALRYMHEVCAWFGVRGYRLDNVKVTRMDLAHVYDCGDSGTSCQLVKELQSAGQIGNSKRISYDQGGVVWGQGSSRKHITCYRMPSKPFGRLTTDVDQGYMGRFVRFELQLHSELAEILGSERSLRLDTVNWVQVYEQYVGRLAINAGDHVINCDELARYNMTAAQEGTVSRWLSGRLVPEIQTNTYMRRAILLATTGEIDIATEPQLASRWSQQRVWDYLNTRICTHRPPGYRQALERARVLSSEAALRKAPPAPRSWMSP